MITINENWKAAFSQSGVEPIVHIRILDLDTFTDATCVTVNNSAQITCNTTAALVEGMTVSGDDIPSRAFIVSIDEPSTPGGVGTKFTISAVATGSGSSTLTFGKTYQMTTGNFNRRSLSPRFRADPIILNIVPVSVKMDHWKREPQIGELSVEIADDGTFRRLITTLGYNLKRKKVEVRVGAFGLDLVDYQIVFLGNLFDFTNSDGVITLKLRDFFQVVSEEMTREPWHNTHPLVVIKRLLNEIGIADEAIDTDSFDPDHSSNASIGHYCVTGYRPLIMTHEYDTLGHVSGPMRLERPHLRDAGSFLWPTAGGRVSVPAAPVIKEFARSVYGFVHHGSDGRLKFRRYDSTNSTDRHLTVDDYGSYSQVSNSGDVVNDIHISIGFDEKVKEFRLRNEASVTKYGEHPVKLGDHPYSATTTFAFLNRTSPDFSTTDTSLTVWSSQTNGLAGTRGAIPGPQGANATVTAARPLHLLNGVEIISATSVSTPVDVNPSDQLWLPPYGTDGDWGTGQAWEKAPNRAVVSGMTRGVKGTTAESINLSDGTSRSDRPWEHFGPNQEIPEWWVKPLWDISMVYDFGNEILKRYQDGLPTIELIVPLSQYDLELGDFITVDAEDFVHANISSLDSNTRWEIIGKESVFFGDSLGITLTCVFVNASAPVGTIIMPIKPPKQFGNLSKPFGDYFVSNAVSGVCVISGLEVTASGSAIDIEGGVCSFGGRSQSFSSIKSGTLPADSDCFVGISDLGFPTLTCVDNGEDSPSTGPGEIRLAKVFTGSGGTVSSVLDLRQFGGVSSRNLSGDSVLDNSGLRNANFSIWGRGPTRAPDNWYYNEASGSFQAKWGQGLIARSGRFSLLAMGGGTASSYSDLASSIVPIEPSTHYRITLWAKAGAIGEEFNFYFEEFVSSITDWDFRTSLGKAGSTVAVGSTDWEPYVLFLTTQASSVYGRLRLTRPAVSGGVGNADMFFDSFTIDKIPHHFSVRKTSNQTFSTSATAEVVSWDVGVIDSGTFNLSADKFIADREGLYSFQLGILYQNAYANNPVTDSFIGFHRTCTEDPLETGYLRKRTIPEIEDLNLRTITLEISNVHLFKYDHVDVRFYKGAGGTFAVAAAATAHSLDNYFSGRDITG